MEVSNSEKTSRSGRHVKAPTKYAHVMEVRFKSRKPKAARTAIEVEFEEETEMLEINETPKKKRRRRSRKTANILLPLMEDVATEKSFPSLLDEESNPFLPEVSTNGQLDAVEDALGNPSIRIKFTAGKASIIEPPKSDVAIPDGNEVAVEKNENIGSSKTVKITKKPVKEAKNGTETIKVKKMPPALSLDSPFERMRPKVNGLVRKMQDGAINVMEGEKPSLPDVQVKKRKRRTVANPAENGGPHPEDGVGSQVIAKRTRRKRIKSVPHENGMETTFRNGDNNSVRMSVSVNHVDLIAIAADSGFGTLFKRNTSYLEGGVGTSSDKISKETNGKMREKDDRRDPAEKERRREQALMSSEQCALHFAKVNMDLTELIRTHHLSGSSLLLLSRAQFLDLFRDRLHLGTALKVHNAICTWRQAFF